VIYIILDAKVGNYMGTYRSETEALADVSDTVARFGNGYVSDWVLTSKDPGGDVTVIAEGNALIARAHDARSKV
jgi:hypothetical protein